MAAVSAFGAGYWASVKWLKLKFETAAFDWMPRRLDGMKILHISDLHGNNPEKMNLNIWPAVEALDFDIAVITGDMVVTDLPEMEPHMGGLRRLALRAPTFYVEGNHEIMFFEEMADELRQAGVTVLDNECQVWNIRGFGPLPVIGLRDYTILKDNRFKKADRLLREQSGSFHIVLSHEPQIFYRMKELPLGLVLAGHTHGGQVRLPLLPTLYAPGQGVLPRYGDGWFTEGCNRMYISRGIGTTLFPIRLFNRPEVAVITLKAGE